VTEIVIAGGGLGAVRTAQALRDLGHKERLVLVSREHEPPYDRPPLSKDFLLGRAGDDDIRLLAEERYAELDVELKLGHGAVALDPGQRTLTLDGGEQLSYDALVVATGSEPIRIAALEGLGGVHYLRTAEDSRALRTELREGVRVGIVGAGFIGLEIAGVARTLGCEVTVVEGLPAPLAAVVGPELGGIVQELHEGHGVAFRCGTMLAGARGDGRVSALELADGSSLDVDVVVVGVGVRPGVEWLRGSGLELHHGVVCDRNGRTSDPHVVGVGDAICVHHEGMCTPVGHWTATGDQAMRAAETLLGQADAEPAGDDGYFWSDQFDVRIQFSGRVPEAATVAIESGEVGERKFVAICRDGEQPTAVFAMNSPRDFIRSTIALPR
jgi:3-phenylpropionate/trans-cinnamate dioxygenase ferredoxin reductase subunit